MLFVRLLVLSLMISVTAAVFGMKPLLWGRAVTVTDQLGTLVPPAAGVTTIPLFAISDVSEDTPVTSKSGGDYVLTSSGKWLIGRRGLSGNNRSERAPDQYMGRKSGLQR